MSEMLREIGDLTTYPSGVIARSDTSHLRGLLLLDALTEIIAVVARAELFAAEKGDPDESALFHELAALRSKLAGEER